MRTLEYWNRCIYEAQDDKKAKGHYESWFQRGNHPTRPLAFWIRYTIFSPRNRPQDAIGELWAVYFNGEKSDGKITAVKKEFSLDRCKFSPDRMEHRVGDAYLKSASLSGEIDGQGNEIAWDLRYISPDPYLLFLPENLYKLPFPKAKSLVGSPLAIFSGSLQVNGEKIEISKWVGSQNHNWGSQHTDNYAWGQVSGFDNDSDAFFEVATARIRLGPFHSPWMTLMVLRVDGQEYRLNSILQSVRAQGKFNFFSWHFYSSNRQLSIRGEISAPKEAFIGLPYNNPPGGVKTCLNSKLASCRITIHKRGEQPRFLKTKYRGAFEILTDKNNHKVPVLKL